MLGPLPVCQHRVLASPPERLGGASSVVHLLTSQPPPSSHRAARLHVHRLKNPVNLPVHVTITPGARAANTVSRDRAGRAEDMPLRAREAERSRRTGGQTQPLARPACARRPIRQITRPRRAATVSSCATILRRRALSQRPRSCAPASNWPCSLLERSLNSGRL